MLQPELCAPVREAHPGLLPEQPAECPLARTDSRAELRQRTVIRRIRPQEGGDSAQPAVGQRGEPHRQLIYPPQLVQRYSFEVGTLPDRVGRIRVSGRREDDLAQQRADRQHGGTVQAKRINGSRKRFQAGRLDGMTITGQQLKPGTTAASGLTLAATLGNSLPQPVFGLIADRLRAGWMAGAGVGLAGLVTPPRHGTPDATSGACSRRLPASRSCARRRSSA